MAPSCLTSFVPLWLRRVASALVVAVAVLTVLPVPPVQAQELDCTVNVDYRQLQGSDYQFLDELQRQMREYLNERTWTDDQFQPQERIDCSFQVLLREAISLTEFRARLVVAMKRPIHDTGQTSPVLRINDSEWTFEYSRGQQLIYNLNSFDPLTSVLDYYAYILLGYDYDTFAEGGGTPHFQTARRVADRAESVGGTEWSRLSGDQSRPQIVTEILDSRYQPLRQAYTTYHLEGLDRFVSKTEAARQTILDVLIELQRLNQNVSRSYVLSIFFASKYQELTAIFRDSPLADRAYQILSELDPAHSTEYNRLVN